MTRMTCSWGVVGLGSYDTNDERRDRESTRSGDFIRRSEKEDGGPGAAVEWCLSRSDYFFGGAPAASLAACLAASEASLAASFAALAASFEASAAADAASAADGSVVGVMSLASPVVGAVADDGMAAVDGIAGVIGAAGIVSAGVIGAGGIVSAGAAAVDAAGSVGVASSCFVQPARPSATSAPQTSASRVLYNVSFRMLLLLVRATLPALGAGGIRETP